VREKDAQFVLNDILLTLKVTTMHGIITRLSRDTANGTQPLYSSGLR